MKQTTLFTNIRTNHYKEQIPALATLLQLAETIGYSDVKNQANLVNGVIKSFLDDAISYGHVMNVVVCFQDSANVLEAACEAHKRVFGCNKQGSLIESLEGKRIKGRHLQMFWHQLANILTQAISAPAAVQGALTRHLMQVDSEWFPE